MKSQLGLPTNEHYKSLYKTTKYGKVGKCLSKNDIVKFRVKDYVLVELADLAHVLAKEGPLSVVIKPPPIFYKGGVINDKDTSHYYCLNNNESAHAALLVGYDQDSFIVKNSWSNTWYYNVILFYFESIA